ncbi:uncharacterized protein LOC125651527 isoform X3 [Ostrea edulis]|uniref:uncharacterized protein LOC125651527 isoform X3 n=1 Tax=Ostrea edulis TaxID=37623 RepID=UPI0024AFEB93|nr:uncharacterized protein LOC125651527 isoform X3 [Ostrea edulis]
MARQTPTLSLLIVTVTLLLRNGHGLKICGTAAMTYNPYTHVCCNGTVSKKMEAVSCCNGADELYDEKKRLCCGDKTYPIWDRWDRARKCCGGHLHNSTKDMDCCGESQYNTTTHICCENKAFKKMKGIICCLSEAYDPTTHHCVDDKVLLLTQGICSNVTYNTSSMRCCDNRVLHNISVYTNPVDCCGTQVYSINTQQCCHGTNIRAPKNEKCCGQGSINTSLYICCNGVNHSRSSAELVCCGNQAFDKNHEGCCEGTIYNQKDQHCCGDRNIAKLDQKCCGIHVFDPTTELCCNNTETPSVISRNTTSGVTSQCPQYRATNVCGSTAYDMKLDLCCNSKVYENGIARGKDCCELDGSPYCALNGKMMRKSNQPQASQKYGVCRICDKKIPSFLGLIRGRTVSVCDKQVFMFNVTSAVRAGRFWLLNLTSDATENTEKQRKKEIMLRVLVPCKCSQLGNTSAQYVLLTRSAVVPGRLLRLGDDDFLLPKKEKASSIIFRIQAKCKHSRKQFIEELKKRMRKRADKILHELLQLKIR